MANSVRLSQATDMSHGGAGVQEEFRQDIARFWTVRYMDLLHIILCTAASRPKVQTSFVRVLCGSTGACQPPAARSKHYRQVGLSPDLRYAYRQARHPLNSHRRCRSGVYTSRSLKERKTIYGPSEARCIHTPAFLKSTLSCVQESLSSSSDRGRPRENKGQLHVRSYPHLLLIGDPGTGALFMVYLAEAALD